MNYPDWAPKSLVELHRYIADPNNSAYRGNDPESIVAGFLQKSETPISEGNVEDLRRQLYRTMIFSGLPAEEEIALLEKLITNHSMKPVWASLSKRFKDEQKDPRLFFFYCKRGITDWRGDQKQTPAERRAFYQELYDTVAKLSSLMHKASGFDHYSVDDLVKNDSIEWLVDTLEIPQLYSPETEKDISYIRFCLSEIIPSVDDLLGDIGKKAITLRDESALVKKPNSQNAGAHYFIRALSGHCQKSYGQPLHEVVAITTSVIFDLPNCDEDYVRKIVRA